MKPGPMGPGGKVSIKDDASWMDGGFFVVFRSTLKSAMGDGTAIAFMGYDPQEKLYTYDEFNNAGQAVHSKGTLDADTLTWINQVKMGPQTVKARYAEDGVADLIQLQVRNVARRHQLEPGHGGESHEEQMKARAHAGPGSLVAFSQPGTGPSSSRTRDSRPTD
jgi:hypothetical protein